MICLFFLCRRLSFWKLKLLLKYWVLLGHRDIFLYFWIVLFCKSYIENIFYINLYDYRSISCRISKGLGLSSTSKEVHLLIKLATNSSNSLTFRHLSSGRLSESGFGNVAIIEFSKLVIFSFVFLIEETEVRVLFKFLEEFYRTR